MSSPNQAFDDEKPPLATVGKLPGGDTVYSVPSTSGSAVGKLPPTLKVPAVNPHRNVAISIKSR